jgi:hypothetical protein
MDEKLIGEDTIKKILKYDTDTKLVKIHESKQIEFKENFNFANKKDYFKAMASFANASGGYIFFGVKDKPRELVGLGDKRIEEFDNMKLEDFTVDLNNFFNPEILWDSNSLVLVDNIKIGVIYVYESESKPVICKKRYESKDKKLSTVEGEIYYRYYGRNERIHYDDLIKIINQEKEKESKKWINLFSKISKVGVDNVGLLNFNTGIFSAGNSSVILDEQMLSNIKFIKEGEFNERRGIPTLNVIGNIELKQGKVVVAPEKIKVKGIRFSDIVLDFLDQKEINNSIDYITQICHESSGYLPTYYYISKSNKLISEIIDIIKNEVIRSQSKTLLLKRLETKQIDQETIGKNASVKQQYCNDIINHIKSFDINYVEENYDTYKILSAILTMNQKDIMECKNILLRILKSYYIKNYQIDSKFASAFRKVICWIDEALYMEKN